MSLFRVLLLAAVWIVLTRELTLLNVLLGLGLGALLVRGMWSLERGAASGRGRSRGSVRTLAAAACRALSRPVRALDLAAFFLYEMALSNVRIAAIIMRPRMNVTSTVLDIPVEAESEEELALLSDLVTLTPGTLTLDVTDDGRTLFVHVLSAEDPDEVRRAIREGLARRVRRLFE